MVKRLMSKIFVRTDEWGIRGEVRVEQGDRKALEVELSGRCSILKT